MAAKPSEATAAVPTSTALARPWAAAWRSSGTAADTKIGVDLKPIPSNHNQAAVNATKDTKPSTRPKEAENTAQIINTPIAQRRAP